MRQVYLHKKKTENNYAFKKNTREKKLRAKSYNNSFIGA
jgi:hypothetical protein